jgi:sucrose-6-phosphate hydrolase SacC (GH32 family)
MRIRMAGLSAALSGAAVIAAAEPKLADEWSTFSLYAGVGYDQPLRPQFHFTSRMGWLNDPNGMVYYDGEWHMCFQHHAKGNISGPKSWGNAVSRDLMHWQQLPHAINPYPNVKWEQGAIHAIWSGSAVVDGLNALGKQHGEVKTLFAIYTATHTGEDKKAAFFQAGAFSTDKGRTWSKINGGRPLIDHQPDGEGGQRDPKVFYHPASNSYVLIMMVGGKDRAVRLWRSTDLLHWEKLGDIPNKAAECLDMFSVAVDGDSKNVKWVIADAGTRYEVGDFDGRTWTGLGAKDKDGRPLRFDFGDAYYAAQVFNQAPDHRAVHIGWLQSKSAGYSPFTEAGMPFTQQMSIPAEITLRTTPEGIRLFRNPVGELAALHAKTSKFENLSVEAANAKLAPLAPELIDLSIAFVPTGDLTLHVRGLAIQYDAAKREFAFTNTARVEGERAGMIKLPADKRRPYTDNGRRAIRAPEVNGEVKLRVLVDRASLELFVNDGEAAASFVVVPDSKNRTLSLTAGGATQIKLLEVNELKSAWVGR